LIVRCASFHLRRSTLDLHTDVRKAARLHDHLSPAPDFVRLEGEYRRFSLGVTRLNG
jgi:hypothetical protein